MILKKKYNPGLLLILIALSQLVLSDGDHKYYKIDDFTGGYFKIVSKDEGTFFFIYIKLILLKFVYEN